MKLYYLLFLILFFYNSFAQNRIPNGIYGNHWDMSFHFKNDSVGIDYRSENNSGYYYHQGKYNINNDSLFISIDAIKQKGEYTATIGRVGFHTRKRKNYLVNLYVFKNGFTNEFQYFDKNVDSIHVAFYDSRNRKIKSASYNIFKLNEMPIFEFDNRITHNICKVRKLVT